MPDKPSHAPRTRHVLVVDDEQDIVDSLQALLQSALPNVDVVTALNGPDGLRLMQTGPVDLVISDYKMPGMTGLQFLEEARKIAPRVSRMLLTAFPDLDVAMQAINDAGIERFFTKPIDARIVVEAVRTSLSSRQARESRDQALGRALAMRKGR